MKLCKHVPYVYIDHILDPKFSTNEILIDTRKIVDGVDNYIFQFSSPKSKERYGKFYIAGSVIRKSAKQKNGGIYVYAVDLNKREAFEQEKPCVHDYK